MFRICQLLHVKQKVKNNEDTLGVKRCMAIFAIIVVNARNLRYYHFHLCAAEDKISGRTNEYALLTTYIQYLVEPVSSHVFRKSLFFEATKHEQRKKKRCNILSDIF